ncbi:tryptophan--tRNA ligase [Candidatus Nanogingivalis gingivitcus]|jgi:tryptophan--tRNA ligase|uniref:Tryptophan--tRNA ligase n=1 Tax=Candidatus Nanogingivalis gingivitcus TaxID=2171992 RepID=A0ABY0FIQ3_9BACT|nr:tryptophan--tRNA ligase [Candidatus Nanogingivalis gingivitcus]RYC72813.1 Tryptophan--tRNA ligase 2 [Candidatus Nanogingivalis gingivitcus]
MDKKIILTGDRPTGRLHIGHYIGSLRNRVELQNSNKFNEIFVMIADAQALTDNAKNPKKVQENVLEVALDYLAVGLNPEKTTIFIQSQVPQLAELSQYYANLVSISRLERNPTVKTEIKQKNFGESVPSGFVFYPISQAADITAFKATTIPVGEDQAPMIELTREIARSFNQTYGSNVLVEPEMFLAEEGISRRLPGIDGINSKMSKSLNNGIYLADSYEEMKAKVMKMYTDPDHIRVEDPGKIEGNVVFAYLDVFAKDKQKVEEMKAHYQKGGLGDVAVKMYLVEVLDEILKPIREKREELAKNPEEVYKMLAIGSEKARAKAQETLEEVKDAMQINYFKDL